MGTHRAGANAARRRGETLTGRLLDAVWTVRIGAAVSQRELAAEFGLSHGLPW